MNDPRRLLDGDADEFESALLRSVQREAMSATSRRRILAGLGVGGAIFLTSAVAGSSAIGAPIGFFKGATLLAFKWIVICSAVALVPAGVWVAQSHRAHPPSAQPAPLAAVVSHPVAVAASETSEPKRPADRAIPVRAAPARELKSTPRSVPSSAAQPPLTLSDEVGALQAARVALANQDPGAALASLDRYKARFPSGRLAPEATVLRIEALVARGDRSQASALANQLEASSPDSPYIERIESMLGRAKQKSAR
jgi:hypothetical protein